MKQLFLTNFYPPVSRGGYEQWCQEVADGLTSRGHDVLVLTSTHRRNTVQNDPLWIRRELHLEMELASLRNALQFFTTRNKHEKENLTLLQETIRDFLPDTILVWGMWNLPRSLPALAEKLMPGRVAYYMGDYWPTLPDQFENYWNAPPRNSITGLPKMLLRPLARKILSHKEQPALALDRVLFPSAFMQSEFMRKKIAPQDARVIYGSIDTSLYRQHLQGDFGQSETVSLLYIGRLTYEKGVHTSIEAVARLVNEYKLTNLKLTVVGEGDAGYVDHLYNLVNKNKLASFVTFLPAQPKENLPPLYHRSDIFLFTSIWAEPFGRVIVEAMASGVAVVGTAVGGAAEILIDNKNALTFTPDDPVSLAKQIKRLIESRSLRERLATSGREMAVDKFDIQRMTTEIDSYLQTLIS